MWNTSKFINSAGRYLVMLITVLLPNSSTIGLTLKLRQPGYLPLSAFIHTEENDDLMFFYQIDDKINSHYLFI